MKVQVELQAYLDQYSPNGQSEVEVDVPEGARVADILQKLTIPEDMAQVIIVGNVNAGTDHPLSEGDRVTLIPPLAGG
jgi:sulfur-carrier protein